MSKCEACGEGFSGKGRFCDECQMEMDITKAQDEAWSPPPIKISSGYDSPEENQRRSEFPSSWPYFSLVHGRLVDENGLEGNRNWPSFNDVDKAERFLADNDIRGNVRAGTQPSLKKGLTVLEFGEPQNMGMSQIYGLWMWRIPEYEDLSALGSIPGENWKLVDRESGVFSEIPKNKELKNKGMLAHGHGRYVVAIGKGSNFEWKELNKK